jgi:hypothetical protein
MPTKQCYCNLVSIHIGDNKGIYCPLHTRDKGVTYPWNFWNCKPRNFKHSESLNRPFWLGPDEIRIPLFVPEVSGPEGDVIYSQTGTRKVARFSNPMSLKDYKSLYAHLDDETGEYYWMVASDVNPMYLNLLGKFMAFRHTMEKRTFLEKTKTGHRSVVKTMYFVKQVRFPPPRPGLLEPGVNMLKLEALERIEVSHQVTLHSIDRLLS